VADPRLIREVVVAGGGIVAWSAAAALRRHLPSLAVTVLASPPAADALADRIGSTLPSIVGFHGDLGLTEADTVARTGSGYRLGTRFEEWSAGLPSYVHSYGEHGRPFEATSFHLHWIRAAREGKAPPFDGFSAAAALARSGRFVHPQGDPGTPLAAFEYGLQLNIPGYADLMRAFALHLGAQERRGELAEPILRAKDGFIEALRLADGSLVGGDLFIDCTGPAARLRSALDTRFEEWSSFLPCDRVLMAEGPAPADLPVLDTAVAGAAGWRWQAASPARASHGLVYASGHLSDSQAERVLRVQSGAAPTEAPVRLRQGCRPEPWLRNCVAIGDSAMAVEPLEWTNLHLAHSAIDRIVSMMPDRDCAPVELAEYNRQAAAEAARVRDFLMLHYVTARRSEPFWREAAAAPMPDTLAHTLGLFRERGRLPFHEEETFTRDSWLTLLLGQGELPRRADPLTETIPAEAVDAGMKRMAAALASIAQTLPTHSAYLANLASRGRR
jgi:tryptophan halogenase